MSLENVIEKKNEEYKRIQKVLYSTIEECKISPESFKKYYQLDLENLGKDLNQERVSKFMDNVGRYYLRLRKNDLHLCDALSLLKYGFISK
jgi:hypothetical protein